MKTHDKPALTLHLAHTGRAGEQVPQSASASPHGPGPPHTRHFPEEAHGRMWPTSTLKRLLEPSGTECSLFSKTLSIQRTRGAPLAVCGKGGGTVFEALLSREKHFVSAE